jgi:hypothetical protein
MAFFLSFLVLTRIVLPPFSCLFQSAFRDKLGIDLRVRCYKNPWVVFNTDLTWHDSARKFTFQVGPEFL